MLIEIKLPELGENIESADVVSILVKEGDMIQNDQGLFEIETDKATLKFLQHTRVSFRRF